MSDHAAAIRRRRRRGPPAARPLRARRGRVRGAVPRVRPRRGDRQRGAGDLRAEPRSEEHTSELQSLMRISYAVFCLKKKNKKTIDSVSDTLKTMKQRPEL